MNRILLVISLVISPLVIAGVAVAKPVTYNISMSLDIKGEKVSFPKFALEEGKEQVVEGHNGLIAKVKAREEIDKDIRLVRFFASVSRKTGKNLQMVIAPEIITLENEEAFAATFDSQGKVTEFKMLAARQK